jgi:hypothetical protein
MNKYILKVMRYQDNTELFNFEEMRENDTEAYTASEAAYAAAEAAAYTAAYTAEAAAYADAAYADAAYTANIDKYWVNKYFKFTDENKQDYTNEVERLK